MMIFDMLADLVFTLQVIKEVFCWTREPMEVRRITERKEAVLTELLGDMQPLLAPDVPKFMESLASSKVCAPTYSPAHFIL